MRRGQRRIQPRTGIEYVVGEFCPELVGKAIGYPRTEAAYEERRAMLVANRQRALDAGRLTRRGVPNGWAGRRDAAAAARRNSQTEAERLATTIREISDPNGREDPMVADALDAALGIAMDPTTPTPLRLQAWRTWLTHKLPMPTMRTIMQADDPLMFLSAIAEAAKGLRRHEECCVGAPRDERKKRDE
jgi:hypothetical protein